VGRSRLSSQPSSVLGRDYERAIQGSWREDTSQPWERVGEKKDVIDGGAGRRGRGLGGGAGDDRVVVGMMRRGRRCR
jgi:hypothetical protein